MIKIHYKNPKVYARLLSTRTNWRRFTHIVSLSRVQRCGRKKILDRIKKRRIGRR